MWRRDVCRWNANGPIANIRHYYLTPGDALASVPPSTCPPVPGAPRLARGRRTCTTYYVPSARVWSEMFEQEYSACCSFGPPASPSDVRSGLDSGIDIDGDDRVCRVSADRPRISAWGVGREQVEEDTGRRRRRGSVSLSGGMRPRC